MNRNERLNFNQSLLCHSLYKSQANLSNLSFHKKSHSSLLSQLNMTYSRLTTQTKYDHIKQNPSNQHEIEYEFQNQLKSNKGQILQNQCPNCKIMKYELHSFQLFLLQLQANFIQKELLLQDKFKSINLMLKQKQNQVLNCKLMYQKLQQEFFSIKNTNNNPKNINTKSQIKPICKIKPTFSIQLSQDQTTNKCNILQSTKQSQNFQNIKLKSCIKKPLKHSTTYQTNKQNDQNIISNSSKYTEQSPGSHFQLQYTSSERQSIQSTESFRKNNQNKIDKFQQIMMNKMNKLQNQKDNQLFKLRFQNSNLKSYNSVLLEHIKPRTLASKVFTGLNS